MKQLMLSANGGRAWVEDVPAPAVQPGTVLVRTAVSLISPGTERTTAAFGGRTLLGKALERPDLVRQVVDKVRREGLLTALGGVRSRLERPLTPGYSSAGTVIGLGDGVTGIGLGDRVACGGTGYAVHAEIAVVPRNLVAPLPDGLDFESGAFATLGAVALHAFRLAGVGLGEVVAVIGLGLVGLLSAQLARAAGCTVLGMDPDPARCRLAERCGCSAICATPEQLKSLVSIRSQSDGADAVIIAAATTSGEPVRLAGEVARDRASVVCVGAVGMEIPRALYYEKELSFRVSRSYGPGRYDPAYEERGIDYPIGYVRWTEQRNLRAFAQLAAEGKLEIPPLITHRFPIEEAFKAYDLISGKSGESCLGVLITCSPPSGGRPSAAAPAGRVEVRAAPAAVHPAEGGDRRPGVAVGVLGAGDFAMARLLPAMKRVRGTEFVGICAATGSSARHAARRFGFHCCTTDENEILGDGAISVVVIATRHHLHASQVIAALEADKHVYCEKPLCLNEEELRRIVLASKTHRASLLSVGFNRRFAPMTRQLRAFLAEIKEPLAMHYRVNAGFLPPDHWVQDPDQGGGRIVGELCHFVDLLTVLAGAPPARAGARALPNGGRYRDDNLVASLEFPNGSVGTITYMASGDPGFSKERLEVIGGGSVAVLTDFRRLELVRNGRRRVHRSWLRQNKGHQEEWQTFVAGVRGGGPPPIPLEEIVTTCLATFRIRASLGSGAPLAMDLEGFMASALAGDERDGGPAKTPDVPRRPA